MNARRSRTLLPAAGLATVLIVASPAAAATAWVVVPSQAVGTGSSFSDLHMLSGTDGWAVGNQSSGALIERWNGTQWTVVPAPNILLAGNSFGGLAGVDALSGSTAFAVGSASNYASDGLLHSAAVALRWNGTAWSRMTMPSSTAIVNTLSGMRAFSASDVWAVGRTVPDASGQTLAMHWNGSSWSKITTPSPSTRDNLLLSVNGSAGNDVWAVGYFRDPPYGNVTQHSLILHWNGTAWSRVASPDVGSTQTRLTDVVALSTTDAWAVGSTNVNSVGANDSTAILHWNGTAWKTMPAPAMSAIWSVTAVSPTNIWVAGSTADGLPEFANWQGSAWTVMAAPGVTAAAQPLLTGTTTLGSTVWAVGQLNNTGSSGYKPIVMRNG